MSWIEKAATDYTITCGDGKSYTPQWLNASKNVEYNIAEFVFKELAGTLVYRGQPRGNRYALEVIFTGEDHLDTARDFEASAADPRAWTISHPYYGNLLVQPVSLTFDNSEYNATRITGGVIETIATTPDKPTVSVPDKISADKEEVDVALAESFVNEVPAPKVSAIKNMLGNAEGTYNAALGSIKEGVNVEAFTNGYNSAVSAITRAESNTLGAISAIQSMLSLPATFVGTVASRIGMLNNMMNYLLSTITGINDLAGKKLFENNGAAIITSIIKASVTGTTGSYTNRTQVLGIITGIISSYNNYMSAINGLQSINGGFPGAYIPNAGGIRLLSQLASYGVNALLDVAANSRQERTFFLEENTDLIRLAKRLYGLAQDDSTINSFMAENMIGLNEILELKKGRKIVYYL